MSAPPEEQKVQIPQSDVKQCNNGDKGDGTGNHSLGLQDLYKAAFSQEFSLKDEPEETYQLYSMKQLVYPGQSSECFTTTAPVTSTNPFENNESNSVLDLDKGIHVQVLKVPNDEFQTYTCDSHILQRYLHDATILRGDTNELSNPSSESMFFLTRPVIYDAENAVGIMPEKLGVKYEDCDFNSSDSFASTESIIPKNIQCPKCPKKFMFKSDLARHDKHKHSSKQKQTCQYCGKEFPSHQNLMFHEKSHKKQSGNTCQICNKSFKKSGFLVKHMVQKHQHVSLTCSTCCKSFPTESLLLNHCKKAHAAPNSEKPFPCEVCGKCFEKKQGLTCHIKTHTDENNAQLSCEICGKSFSKTSYLKSHMKVHSEATNPVSENWVSDTPPSDVLGEQKSQIAEKPFKCEHCPKTFSSKTNFTVHVRKHTDSQSYVCSVCQKSFTSSSDLTKHLRAHNKTEGNFKCTICSHEFSTKGGLTTHVKKVHSRLSTQETCTQTSDDLLELENVNLVMDPSLSNSQSIVLTPIGSFNSVPFIITQPQTAPTPYSIS